MKLIRYLVFNHILRSTSYWIHATKCISLIPHATNKIVSIPQATNYILSSAICGTMLIGYLWHDLLLAIRGTNDYWLLAWLAIQPASQHPAASSQLSERVLKVMTHRNTCTLVRVSEVPSKSLISKDMWAATRWLGKYSTSDKHIRLNSGLLGFPMNPWIESSIE